MNPMDVKDGEFYVNAGKTFQSTFAIHLKTKTFGMYEASDIENWHYNINEYTSYLWTDIRPATPEEIRAYKAASPRYPDYKSEPTKPRRKVVQIAATMITDPAYGAYTGTVALCNDGVIFEYRNGRGWLRLPDIPQE